MPRQSRQCPRDRPIAATITAPDSATIAMSTLRDLIGVGSAASAGTAADAGTAAGSLRRTAFLVRAARAGFLAVRVFRDAGVANLQRAGEFAACRPARAAARAAGALSFVIAQSRYFTSTTSLRFSL